MATQQELRPDSDRISAVAWKASVGGSLATYLDLLTNEGSTEAVIQRTTVGGTHDYDFQVTIGNPSHVSGQLPLSVRIIAEIMMYSTGNPIEPTNTNYIGLELCIANPTSIYLGTAIYHKSDSPNGVWTDRELIVDVSKQSWADLDTMFLIMDGEAYLTAGAGTCATYIRNVRIEVVSGIRAEYDVSESAEGLTASLQKNYFSVGSYAFTDASPDTFGFATQINRFSAATFDLAEEGDVFSAQIGQKDLILNSGAEVDTSHWTATYGTLTRTTTNPIAGVGMFKVVCTSSNSVTMSMYHSMVSALAGVFYLFLAMVETNVYRKVYLSVDWYDAGYTFISTSTGEEFIITALNTPFALGLYASAPASAAYATPRINGILFSSATPDTLYADTIHFFENAVPSRVFTFIENGETLTVTLENKHHNAVVNLSESDDIIAITAFVGHNIVVTLVEDGDALTVILPPFSLYALTEDADALALVVVYQWTATTPAIAIMSGQLHVTAVLNAHSGAITAKQCQIAYDSAFTNILADTGISVSTNVATDTVGWYIPWTRSDDDVYFCRVGFRSADFPNVTVWSPNVDAFSASPLAITASAIQSNENIIFSVSVITALHMPPWVTAKVGSTSILMTLVAESGAGPWTYAFTATNPSETGDVSWYVVAIAADNSITTSIAARTLHVVYTEQPSIVLNTLTGRVVIENAVFTDAPIPACASMTCTIEGIVPMGLVTARVSAGGTVKEYRLEATQQSGWPCASVTFRSSFAARLHYPLSGNLASMTAAEAINLIASPWRLAGDAANLLTIPWILASVDGEPLVTVLDKIMTMNGVQLWERSGLLYVVPVAPTMATFGVQRGDGYSKDLTMTNHVREWYTIGAYPSPITLFSNLDSINWTPSPASAILEDTVRPWGTGPLPPSKVGCLGIPKEADRLVSFNLHDYDEFKASWVPTVRDANQILQVALYSDALNYWYAIRPFTQAKGAGWQVTGTNPWDVVQKVVSIASVEVLTVAFDFTSPCRLRVTLYYDSGGSWVSDYVTTDRDGLAAIDVPILNYNDAHTNLVTSIDVDVTNLYDIGGSYGAECTHMWLTKRVGVTTGELQSAVLWSHEYKGISLISVWGGGNNQVLIAEQPPYPVQRIDPMIFNLWNRHKDPNDLETVTPLVIAPALSIGNMGVILNYSTPGAKPQVDYNSQFDVAWLEYDIVLIAYDLTAYTDHVTYSTIKSEIGEDFNLWEDVTIPLSEFIPVGAPTTRIMQMGLRNPGGPLYLDAPHFDVIVPRRGFIDMRDASSIVTYGERFEDRRSDNFTTEAQARAYALGYVAMHRRPRETYGVDLPLSTPLSHLDAALTPEGAVIPVSSISYDFGQGMMHLALGAPENTLNARLLQQAEHADRIERRLT